MLGFVIGVFAGIALGRIPFLAEVVGPFIKIMNSLPRIVVGSLFVVAFGLSMMSKVLRARGGIVDPSLRPGPGAAARSDKGC